MKKKLYLAAAIVLLNTSAFAFVTNAQGPTSSQSAQLAGFGYAWVGGNFPQSDVNITLAGTTLSITSTLAFDSAAATGCKKNSQGHTLIGLKADGTAITCQKSSIPN